jgi:hypothetical protein
VWYPEIATRWGIPLAAAMVVLGLALAGLAGWRLERRDSA